MLSILHSLYNAMQWILSSLEIDSEFSKKAFIVTHTTSPLRILFCFSLKHFRKICEELEAVSIDTVPHNTHKDFKFLSISLTISAGSWNCQLIGNSTQETSFYLKLLIIFGHCPPVLFRSH